ncbi:uncharacterized protein PFL1_05953 [Pseudozyma flocculosa PF-1]|uniref:Uncharacterized protein n=2 Tax=Pseudozyma flocculosa TaxID=84751 RepID=A0A5C3F245_9BASI|nr:uncharacterized protein PFL1_05953 [Pseudozyma flocculosa PF-1]EPQ26632.1 hypothetical protein PFL1_05953 [Pseudozyma flocculosa PF-1]SPO38372.1 uncharacterized protein PSFLO_03849 [Pseudozyma flocculosa]
MVAIKPIYALTGLVVLATVVSARPGLPVDWHVAPIERLVSFYTDRFGSNDAAVEAMRGHLGEIGALSRFDAWRARYGFPESTENQLHELETWINFEGTHFRDELNTKLRSL